MERRNSMGERLRPPLFSRFQCEPYVRPVHEDMGQDVSAIVSTVELKIINHVTRTRNLFDYTFNGINAWNRIAGKSNLYFGIKRENLAVRLGISECKLICDCVWLNEFWLSVLLRCGRNRNSRMPCGCQSVGSRHSDCQQNGGFYRGHKK